MPRVNFSSTAKSTEIVSVRGCANFDYTGDQRVARVKNIFPQMFRKLMREKKLTQAVLSEKTGIPKTTINGWYKRDSEIQELSYPTIPEHIKAICQFFDVDHDYIFFGIGLDADERAEYEREQEQIIKDLEAKLAMNLLEKKELERKIKLLEQNQLTMFEGNINEEILLKTV